MRYQKLCRLRVLRRPKGNRSILMVTFKCGTNGRYENEDETVRGEPGWCEASETCRIPEPRTFTNRD